MKDGGIVDEEAVSRKATVLDRFACIVESWIPI